MKIYFSAPNHLEIDASAAELGSIAMRIERLQMGEKLNIASSGVGDPHPYDRLLHRLVVTAGTGPTLVAVEDETVHVVGSTTCLNAFALFFRFDECEDGAHSHFEYFEGNQFVARASLPLVISCSRSSMEV